MSGTDHTREVKQWENGIIKYDMTKEFAKKNKKLVEGFGKDRFSWTPERTALNSVYWAKHEARIAHGYPYTAWYQLGLLYCCGIYTAQEQGIIKRGTPFARFWRAHYFDWMTFASRGFKYAWLGGLVSGTVLFGSPDISFKRCISYVNYLFMEAALYPTTGPQQVIP